MTDASSRNRQVAGQPTGGQFATEAKGTDTGVSLSAQTEPGTLRESVQVFRNAVQDRHPGVKFDLWPSSSGYVSLDRIDVPKNHRREGVGTQIMEDLTAEADKAGWALSLTADTSLGSSRKRLVDFYKRFGFVENKGRNKDFTTTAGMTRPPQP